jgi:hypothetical protein
LGSAIACRPRSASFWVNVSRSAAEHELAPQLVAVEGVARHRGQAGVLRAADAVLDPGVRPMAGVEHGDVGVGLVGEKRGEPVPVDVVEGLLRAGVQRFTTHDQPRPFRPGRQIDQIGDLRDRRTLAGCALLGDRVDPPAIVERQVVDRGANRRFERHPDREPACDVTDVVEQVVDRPGGVGPDQHVQLIRQFGQLGEARSTIVI